MKILHVLETLSPRYGGPVSVLLAMAATQQRAGHQVTVATTNADHPRGTYHEPGVSLAEEGAVTVHYARLLSALAASDAVVIFDEATPIELIRAIRPDVLVKGGDYTAATVVGADEVSAWGGRVELVPLNTRGRSAMEDYGSVGKAWHTRTGSKLAADGWRLVLARVSAAFDLYPTR